MPTLDQVATISIDKQTSFPTQKGFGKAMFVCYQTVLPGVLLREYSEPSEILDDGFTVNDPLYLAAQIAFSQEIRPEAIIAGFRQTPYTQVVKLTVINVTPGFVYHLKARGPDGVVTTIDYTVLAAATTTTVATALATALGPVASMTAAGAVAVITCTSTAGAICDYYELPDPDDMTVEVTTADPGLAADLSDLETATKKSNGAISWYGFTLDSCGQAEAMAAAAWAQARAVLFVPRTSDTEVADAMVTDDTLSQLKTLAYSRSGAVVAQAAVQDYRDFASLTFFLSRNNPVGSATGAYMQLTGILPDKWSSGQENAIRAKYGTTFTTLNGVSFLYETNTADSDFWDITLGTDWLSVRIQEAILTVELNNKKIPFEDLGIEVFVSAVQAVLDQGVINGILASSPAPVAYGPKLADTLAADRKLRRLRTIKFRGRYAGAIHKMTVQGEVGV